MEFLDDLCVDEMPAMRPPFLMALGVIRGVETLVPRGVTIRDQITYGGRYG